MKKVLYSCKDGIAVITLNQPESLNALNDELKADLIRTVQQALSDKTVRVIILTGKGRAFCAGGDIKSQASRENDAIARREILKDLNELIRDMYKSPIPIITAINGYAVGAGLGLALVGDLIVASSSAKFSAPFLKLGLVADAGVSFLATRRIGSERTKRLLLTGESIDAEVSEEWGLIDWVVESEELIEFSFDLARKIAGQPKTAIDITKSMLNNIHQLPIDAALDQELSSQIVCMLSSDHKERITAFVESNKKD